jgi:2-phospho-L-lactate guanylyltransferase
VATIVIPFRAATPKSRLEGLPGDARRRLAEAMLADVRAACEAVAPTLVADAPGGQGAAVAAVLEGFSGAVAVVNADLPWASAADVRALLAAAPALVAAADGTTNALALADASTFRPRYGPGSAARFAADGLRPLDLPNLAVDVDTLADLERRPDGLGPATRAVLDELRARV